MTIPFLDPVNPPPPLKKLLKVVSIINTQLKLSIHTTTNDSRLVQLFDLCSFRSWSTVTMSKGGIADTLPKGLL